jgi:hypothetical protein
MGVVVVARGILVAGVVAMDSGLLKTVVGGTHMIAEAVVVASGAGAGSRGGGGRLDLLLRTTVVAETIVIDDQGVTSLVCRVLYIWMRMYLRCMTNQYRVMNAVTVLNR